MLKEFKQFAMRGSVVDLAVGVIVGGAFGKIADSLVRDVILPPLGLLASGASFSNLYLTLNGESYASLAEARKDEAPLIAYGEFFNIVLQFILLAFAVFLLVKFVNKLREEPSPSGELLAVKPCPFCISVIDARATRCPNCTSEVPVHAATTAAGPG